jgi:hypothetical protein
MTKFIIGFTIGGIIAYMGHQVIVKQSKLLEDALATK